MLKMVSVGRRVKPSLSPNCLKARCRPSSGPRLRGPGPCRAQQCTLLGGMLHRVLIRGIGRDAPDAIRDPVQLRLVHASRPLLPRCGSCLRSRVEIRSQQFNRLAGDGQLFSACLVQSGCIGLRPTGLFGGMAGQPQCCDAGPFCSAQRLLS